MKKQNFIYLGLNTIDKIDDVSDAIDALPYDSLYSQFEGNNEIFFTFLINALDEEYASVVTSSLSFLISEEKVEVDILATAPTTDMGMENLALIKQMRFWDTFFKDFNFKENELHHDHNDECSCEDGCDCDDGDSCHHEHQIH